MSDRIRIEALAPDHLPLVRRFVERVWDRPRSDAYYEWRYERVPRHCGVLALRDDECVAAIFAFTRDYRFGDRTVECLEAFDWYCLPELRGGGLGLRVRQELMRPGRPVISLGGSAATRAILPRTGYLTLASGRRYTLPLSGSLYAGRKYGRAIAAGFDLLARSWFMPRHSAPPRAAAEWVAVPTIDDAALALYREQDLAGLVPIPDPAIIRWLASGVPALGSYATFYLCVGGTVRGWALCRVFRLDGVRLGEILELHLAHDVRDLYPWSVAQLSAVLAGFGAELLRVSASDPILQSALAQNRYRVEQDLPLMMWCAGLDEPAPPFRLMGTRGDGAFFPLMGSAESRAMFGS